jgi:hypothetical protein
VSEAEIVALLDMTPPEPGERCALCHRRRNKPRQDTSPDSKEMRIKLPVDRMEALEHAVDTLQEYVGADPYSYPRGALMEAAVMLAIQQREEVKRYFNGTD